MQTINTRGRNDRRGERTPLRAAPGDSIATDFRGIVEQAGSHSPLPATEVWIISLDRRTQTDSAGAFVFRDVPAGKLLVQFRHVGYTVVRDSLTLVAGGRPERRFVLSPEAATLDTVHTTAPQRQVVSPLLRGFEERRNSGQGGHFVDDSVLRRSENSTLANVISSHIPGLMVSQNILLSTRKLCRGGAFRSCPKPDCYVTIYLDNAMIYTAKMAEQNTPPPDLTRMGIGISDLAGIEFYAGGITAPEQMHSNDDGCGTIWLWTRER